MKQHRITTLAAISLAFAALARGQTPHIPLTMETRITTNANGVVSAQSIERVQLKDGQYADWLKSTSVTRATKPGCAETTETIVRASTQDRPAETIQRSISREKTAAGETVRINEITRNIFGKDAGQRIIEETSQRESDGVTTVRVVEQAPNRYGQFAVQREEQRCIRELNPSRTVIENRIHTYDGIRGQFDLTGIQTTEIRRQGDAIYTETTLRRTAGDQDRVVGRVLTTETKAYDGTVRRESVEYGQGLYDKMTYMTTSDLKPQRKIVERTSQNPDGTTKFIREVFRRDLNDEWKPAPYSSTGDKP